MNKLTASDFRSLCDSVVSALDSVASCHENEREREMRRVTRNAEELRVAALGRKNVDCESFRAMVLGRVAALVARQEANARAKSLSDEIVVACLAEIRAAAAAGDHEMAHSLENRLRSDVLRAVALGHADSAQLARRALASSSLDFARQCA